MSFARREKQRRIDKAKQLFKKGKTYWEISELLDINEETVKSYFKIEKTENKKESVSLFSYTDKTKDSIDFDMKEGFVCSVCRKYHKNELKKKYSENKFLCPDCFRKLTPEQIEKYL